MKDSHTSKRTYEPTIEHRTPRGRKALKVNPCAFISHDGTNWILGDGEPDVDNAWVFVPTTVFSNGTLRLRYDAHRQMKIYFTDPATGNNGMVIASESTNVLIGTDTFANIPTVELLRTDLEALFVGF